MKATGKPNRTGRAMRAAAGEATPSLRKKVSKGKEYWYWVATVTINVLPDGTRIRKDVSAQTREECQAKIDALIEQRALLAAEEADKAQYDPSIVKANKTTVKFWMRYWLQSIDGTVKPNTLATYKAMVDEHIIPGLGTNKLIGLKRPQIEKWVQGLRNSKTDEPLSDTGKRYAALVLHIALQAAVNEGVLLVNPADNLKTPKARKKEYKPIEDIDMHRLMQYVQQHSNYPQVIEILLLTGICKGEALGLSWDSVFDTDEDSDKKGTILIGQQLQYNKKTHRLEITPPKYNKSRYIRPTQRVMDILQEIKAMQERQKEAVNVNGGTWGNNWNLVFTRDDGRPINPATLYVDFTRCCKAIGLSNVRVHDLRHQYATHELANGTGVASVTKILGHTSEAYTLAKYANIILEVQRHTSQMMDQYADRILDSCLRHSKNGHRPSVTGNQTASDGKLNRQKREN